jgi:hypothetical protein
MLLQMWKIHQQKLLKKVAQTMPRRCPDVNSSSSVDAFVLEATAKSSQAMDCLAQRNVFGAELTHPFIAFFWQSSIASNSDVPHDQAMDRLALRNVFGAKLMRQKIAWM